MYDCPNCGGNLRFDISLQKLHCDYCGTDLDPYSYEKKKDAVESQVFETTVYTCPQCGGEIMTTNVSATGFCRPGSSLSRRPRRTAKNLLPP